MRTLFDQLDERKPATAVVSRLSDRLPPREYQHEGHDDFFAAYDRGERGMLYRLATGCGKTFLAAWTAEDWLAADPERRRVMVIAYEREHAKQFRDELEGFLPHVTVGLEMGSDGQVSPEHVPPIVVSMRQTLALDDEGRSRLFKFDPHGFDWLVIIEEAHGWAYKLVSCRHIVDWFEANPANARLGLTATPQRGDGTSLGRLFGHVCVELRLGEAVRQGYLVPSRQRFILVEGVDFRKLHEVAGDFDENELGEKLSEQEPLVSAVHPLLDHVGDRRTIVFCATREHARRVALTINAEIYDKKLPHGPAESMDGETPDAIRDEIKRRHKTGQSQFLVVCNLCRAGYDDPGIAAVAVFRPTKSRTLSEQMRGRGVRTLRGTINGLDTVEERVAAIAASAKPDCLVIDLVGVSGMPEVASTLQLYAEGEPDEVVERANALVERGEEAVDEALKTAKAEIAAEKEAARIAREEAERKAADEARRLARLGAEVRYTARDVAGAGDGGAHTDFGRMAGPPATDAQVAFLVRALGWREASARKLSKRQASGVIAKKQRRADFGAEPVMRPVTNPAGPPNERQLRVLEKHRRPIPQTYAEAADLIRGINQELAKR